MVQTLAIQTASHKHDRGHNSRWKARESVQGRRAQQLFDQLSMKTLLTLALVSFGCDGVEGGCSRGADGEAFGGESVS